MEPQDVPLLSGFTGGIKRASAPHLLQPNEMQQAFDCALYGDQAGILGPRRGRSRHSEYGADIVGVGPLSVPWGEYWTIARTDGVVETTLVSSPSSIPSPAIPGFLRIQTGSLTASRTGVGTTNSSDYTHAAVDLATIGQMSFAGATLANQLQGNCNDSYTTGTVTLQAIVNGSYTDVVRLLIDQSNIDYQYAIQNLPSSGSLTGWRAQTVISSGSGTIQGIWSGYIYLTYGSVLGVL